MNLLEQFVTDQMQFVNKLGQFVKIARAVVEPNWWWGGCVDQGSSDLRKGDPRAVVEWTGGGLSNCDKLSREMLREFWVFCWGSGGTDLVGGRVCSRLPGFREA